MTRRISPELLAAGGMLAAFAVLAVWAQHGTIPGDTRPFVWAYTHRVGGDGPRASLQELFGALGTRPVAALTVAVAAWIVGRNVGAREAVAFLVSTAIVFPAELIQRLLGPTYLARFIVPRDANFPSVHVVYAIASWGFLAVLAARLGRREIVVVLALMTLAMGVLRVTVAAHFPSDVVAGYLLGGAWLLVVVALSSTTSWTARG